VQLNLPGITPRDLLSAPDEVPLIFCRNKATGAIEFVLDKLESFRMLILTYE